MDHKVEDRKVEEALFHDFIRGQELTVDPSQKEYYTSNVKFYAVTRASREHFTNWLKRRARGKRVLDYGCGDGETSFLLVEYGARQVVGIDISPISIENCKREAKRRGLQDRCEFRVMDAENLEFADNEFDLIVVLGVLHHMDVSKAFPELQRVLKPTGVAMCLEALGHNPIFQAYRERTPHLRTAWETKHIIRRRDLELASRYFGRTRMRFFHMASLLSVPLRNTPLFKPILCVLDIADDVLMRLPGIKWQGWMIWFVLSEPRKNASQANSTSE